MNELESLNRALFLKINGGPYTAAWLIDVAAVLADALIYLVPLLLIGMWMTGQQRHRALALKALLVACVSLAINQIIGLLWMHPRPFMLHLGNAWTTHIADSSFPSDHMTVFASVGIPLLLDGAFGLGLAVLFCGLGVAWARVFLGVHFPLDMVGAVIVVSACYGILTPPWNRMASRCTQLAERFYRMLLAWPIAAGWLPR